MWRASHAVRFVCFPTCHQMGHIPVLVFLLCGRSLALRGLILIARSSHPVSAMSRGLVYSGLSNHWYILALA